MKSKENTFITMLLITATILGVLVVGSWQSHSAEATTIDRTMSGDYIMATADISDSMSLLYVIDIPKQRLLVYAADPQGTRVQVVDNRIDLDRIFNR
jgi:hypothetical protein